MVRYQVIQSGGVFDFDTLTRITDRSSTAWQDYQSWLTAGNSPTPPDPKPVFDQLTHRCDAVNPAAVNGVSTGQWKVTALPADIALANQTAAAKITQDEADKQTARGYAKLAALKAMTPAQVSAWADANITTLAQARDAIKTLAIAVAILSRRI